MMIGWILPLVLVVLLLSHRSDERSVLRQSPPVDPEAEQILGLRLAKGQITPEEYDLLRNKVKVD